MSFVLDLLPPSLRESCREMSIAKSVPSVSSGSAYYAGNPIKWTKKKYRGNDDRIFHPRSSEVVLSNRISYYPKV